MNPTHSMPSPVSPYESQAKRTNSMTTQQACYPSSPQSEHQSQAAGQQQQARGLGLYPGSMPPPQHQSTVSPVMASPHAEWAHPHQHQHQHQHHLGHGPHVSAAEQQAAEYAAASSQAPPDIFSAAFDPFSGFPASSNAGGMVGAHSPEAPGLEFCQTPPSSNVQSHRGSVSSYAQSDSGSAGGAYTPRAKPEDGGAAEWYQAGSGDLQRAISGGAAPSVLAYAHAGPAMGSQTEQLYREPQGDALYRPQHQEWAKGDTHGYLADLADARPPRFDSAGPGPVLPSASRIRKRRSRTTPEEATHECRVCGKLFKRSYNWKSHMETHNPERKYPHPCTHMVGSSPCTKKFQRKTDLDRHVDSVHLKARNHKCSLCGNRFARRDTLRRHTEDGCPKRFELNIREQQQNGAAAPPPPPPAGPQHQRWSFPGPAAASFPPRDRAFSTASPMGPPPPVGAGPYSAFAQQPAPTAVYQH